MSAATKSDVPYCRLDRIDPRGENASSSVAATSRWSHIACLLGYCEHYWRWLALAFIFLLIDSAAQTFLPLFIAHVVSDMVNKSQMRDFVTSIFILAGIALITTAAGGLRAGTFHFVTAKINRRMRRDLFHSITVQGIDFFDSVQTGEILSRLISDCETMSSTLSSTVDVFLSNGLTVVGSLAFMSSMSWRLTLVTVLLIPPIALFTKVYSIYYDHIAERSQQSKANANRIAEEVISSMRSVRAFAAERAERQRFEAELDATLRVDKTKSFALIGFHWVNELANNIILVFLLSAFFVLFCVYSYNFWVAVLLYGGSLVLSGQMTSDQIFAFFLYQLKLGGNFYHLNSVATRLMESVGASRKVVEYLTRRPQIGLESVIGGGGQLRPLPVMGTLEFRAVTFAYPARSNTSVLQNVSFVVQPGEMVALVGPSGAGKSTIFSLLERFYEPSEGQILLDDIPIHRWEHAYFHQKVSLVPQDPVLCSCSIRDNILYGYNYDDDDENGAATGWGEHAAVVSAAKLANIHGFVVAETEHGYETLCGERGVQLSGGQRQRIAIARALVRQPKLLLLDEATSALDARNEQLIREALTVCSLGRTVLIIAHRLSTIKSADRILVMDRGQIVQEGNHEALMAQQDGLYCSMVQRQMGNEQKHRQ